MMTMVFCSIDDVLSSAKVTKLNQKRECDDLTDPVGSFLILLGSFAEVQLDLR